MPELVHNILLKNEEQEVELIPASEEVSEVTSINIQEKYLRLLENYNILQGEHEQLKTKYKLKVKSTNRVIHHYKNKCTGIYNLDKKLHEILRKILSENQIKLLLGKRKKVIWNEEEMAVAFTLRYYSKKSYIYLREKLNYPLPGLSSLRRWASKINMRHGMLKDVLKFMKLAEEAMSDFEKCVVLQFDEVKVKSIVEYDKGLDEIVGPHMQMQVVMARGLFSKWKQPVFVDFDKKNGQRNFIQHYQ